MQGLWFSLSGKLTVLDVPISMWTACWFGRLLVGFVPRLFSCSLLEEVAFDEGIGGHGVQFHHLHVSRVDILLELLGVLTDEAFRVGVQHAGVLFLLELALQVLVCQEKRAVDFAGHRLLEVLLLRQMLILGHTVDDEAVSCARIGSLTFRFIIVAHELDEIGLEDLL